MGSFSHWFKDTNLEYIDEKPLIESLEMESNEPIKEDTKSDTENIVFILDGEEKQINMIMVDAYNYVNFRDIAELLDYHVDYDPFEKIPELTKKATEINQ